MSINKERNWLTLTLLHLEAQSRSHDISMFCIEKCKQPEMLVSSKATTCTLRMEILYMGLQVRKPDLVGAQSCMLKTFFLCICNVLGSGVLDNVKFSIEINVFMKKSNFNPCLVNHMINKILHPW